MDADTLRFTIKKCSFFSFMDKPSENQEFLAILYYNFFTEGKEWNFSYQISVSRRSDQYPC